MAVHQGRRSRWLTLRQVDWQKWATFRHNTYAYILYLIVKCEDAILAILYTTLPIIITITGQWLNSFIFHDIKCISANGWTIIYVGANDICHVMTIHFVQKFQVSAKPFLVYTYGFMQHHMIGVTVCLYRFTVII